MYLSQATVLITIGVPRPAASLETVLSIEQGWVMWPRPGNFVPRLDSFDPLK